MEIGVDEFWRGHQEGELLSDALQTKRSPLFLHDNNIDSS